tara:strand:- start:438 stop:977 length:540 start_codon:yes stop_codon:yes gene_type:complete
MSLSKLIKPGDDVVTSHVDGNFTALANTVSAITTANIENSSIRTRHISTGRGEWKEVTLHTNAGTTTNPAGDTDVCPSPASTKTTTKTGQMVLVVAIAQLESTATMGSATCSADVRLSVDGSDVRTMTVKTVGQEKLQIGTCYAFEATSNSTEIQLTVKGGGTTFKVIDPEIQVIAVRG